MFKELFESQPKLALGDIVTLKSFNDVKSTKAAKGLSTKSMEQYSKYFADHTGEVVSILKGNVGDTIRVDVFNAAVYWPVEFIETRWPAGR